MRKTTLFTTTFLILTKIALSQEEKKLEIIGYADTYWKYDLANKENISTYFANDQNSISIGMIGLGLKKATGKATFYGEVAFGPRGQYLSTPTGDHNDPSNSFHIQNLSISYDFTDKFNMTAGYMGTFIGYEVISPSANFHYSTSYLFGAGPFQNAGIKASYALAEKVSVMVGIFNDWNTYQDLNGVSHFGAQLHITPLDGLSTYLNFLTGSSAGGQSAYSSGTLLDLVASYELSKKVSLALNAADYSFKADEGGGYSGLALYPKYHITDHIAVGLRAEYFKTKDQTSASGASVMSYTFSANFKHKGLTLIPEIRLDNNEQPLFINKNNNPTETASQGSLALVYAF